MTVDKISGKVANHSANAHEHTWLPGSSHHRHLPVQRPERVLLRARRTSKTTARSVRFRVSELQPDRHRDIRMATGARMRNILQQFMTEALVVSLLGGAIGVAIGLAAAAIIGMFGTPIKYSIGPVLLAFSCALATGLIFGYLPARKAARVDPIVALAT